MENARMDDGIIVAVKDEEPIDAVAATDEVGDVSDLKLGPVIRRLREEQSWSLQRLAREAGVSSATIFKIEKDRMVPSVTVLLKLARALKQPIQNLLAHQQTKQRDEWAVFKADERPEFRFAELPLVIQRTVAPMANRKLEAGVYVVDPGGSPTRTPLSAPGEKIYHVLEGRVRFELNGEYVLLEQGDTLHLDATVPHRWENAAEGQSRIFFVVTPPPSFARIDAGR
jgi:transcriptional regulator with XRE-family HTH domain